MATQPLFGLLPAGQPLITAPSSQPNPTSFLYLIPSATPTNPKPFAHLAVFMLPGIALPENTAAAIYIALNPSAFAPGAPARQLRTSSFWGASGQGRRAPCSSYGNGGNPNPGTGAEGGVVIGIDIEDAASVGQRIQQLQQQSQSQSTALVLAKKGGEPSTQLLAQRIIQNAFNFLSGFSGQIGQSGIEVVPLKAFQEWWRKFETKIKNDPSFLERPQD
ncbi:hypothetical protein E0Z10_g2059 [Xylaria hypoxylon]|uniref:Uncharacterized protein n=1 Tax=Xylaria hypoxylon TaxID=37992 RepID=A0A4Z0Z790_9PEZI|nr:hypothetical protein E0Z10_g2059 [Xylaria hypoxylon]